MKKIVIALILFALPQFSWGQLVYFEGTLDGAQAGTPSTATGFAFGSIDIATRLFILNYSFSGLLAQQTAAHVHRGAPGVNGPVVIGAPSFTLGENITYSTTLTDALVGDLLSGNLYLNVHSALYRGGEIRAQLVPVPEPSTYALGGVGVLLLALYQRRRRQARLAAKETVP